MGLGKPSGCCQPGTTDHLGCCFVPRQYTLGEMDKIEALDSANLKPDSLTCQPRVFSPKGNSFSPHTTISFTLDQLAKVTIKVYNVAGQLVEWMAQQQTLGSGKQAIP